METTLKKAMASNLTRQQGEHLPPATASSNDEVELTDEEIKSALDTARFKKAAKIREVVYWESVNKPTQYPAFNTKQLFDYAKAKGNAMVPPTDSNPGFIIDHHNLDAFRKLAGYFAGDPECGLDLNKGLLIFGPIGCGKTIMMRCFASNPTRSFKEVSARTISAEYSQKEGGSNTINYYSNTHQVIDASKYFGQREIGLFVDDLGTETKTKHFGNEMNVLESIILNRYDNPHLKGKTHITSNLSADEIEEFYGPRVRSRLREMFNTITFQLDTPDRRK